MVKVEVYYAPFTFGHVRTPRRPARTPVEELSDETFSLQHLFLVALLHFVVLLPIILWLIPAPTTTEESKDAFTNGLGHLYSAAVHLYYGVYEAYCGFKEISVSFLLHPGCMPGIVTWISCWMAIFLSFSLSSSPKSKNSNKAKGPNRPNNTQRTAVSVNAFRAQLNNRRTHFATNHNSPTRSFFFSLFSTPIRLIVVFGCRLLEWSASLCQAGLTSLRTIIPAKRGRKRRNTSFKVNSSSPRRHKRSRGPFANTPSEHNDSTLPTSRRMPTKTSLLRSRARRFQHPISAGNPHQHLAGYNRQRSNTENRSNTPYYCQNVPCSTRPVPRFHHHRASLNPNNMMAMMASINDLDLDSITHHPWENITLQALRATLQDPKALRESMPKGASYPIIWDSGASISITNDAKDFIGKIKPFPDLKVKGIANKMKAVGRGTVLWTVLDTNGAPRMLKLPAFHVPKISVRLLSTQNLLQQYHGEKIIQDGYTLTLTGIPGDPDRREVNVMVNPKNNLPMSYGYNSDHLQTTSLAFNSTVNEVAHQNANLSPAQKELLKWHYRLGHMNLLKVQFLMRTGVLATTEKTRRLHTLASTLTDLPLCAACQFGKQRRRTEPGTKTIIVKDKQGVTKDGNLHPGQCISVDHFVCSTKGRRFDSKGKSKINDLYTGGAIFVDHASGYTWIGFQSHLNTHETLSVKESFELFCREIGVVPLQYLTDNGAAFTSKDYTQSLRTFAQISRFAGVGAHHHAGIAERAIQTIMSIARTMMLHAAIHWPELADPMLWPMAVSHAVYLHNHVPRTDTGISPHDLFTRVRWEQRKFHDLHVWGCPVYVLQKSIADGKKLPRWKPRSTRCQLMGLSNRHASLVPLVLNPDTGYITPQFHVVFDDWFSTIAMTYEQLPDFFTDTWYKLFGDSSYQYIDLDNDDAPNIEAPTTTDEAAQQSYTQRESDVAHAIGTHRPFAVLPSPSQPSSTPGTFPLSNPRATPIGAPAPSSTPSNRPVSIPAPNEEPVYQPSPKRMSFSNTPLPQREKTDQVAETSPSTTPLLPSPSPNTTPSPGPSPQREIRPQRESRPRKSTQPTSGSTPSLAPTITTCRSGRTVKRPTRLVEEINVATVHPTAPPSVDHSDLLTVMKASLSDPDTLSYDEAMRDADIDKWKVAAHKEIMELEGKGTWEEVPKSQAKTRILPGTWVFKRKRTPDGEILKHKARYCVRGDLQETEQENYSPVVHWSSIRIVLTISLILGWELACIDFNNAFVQATLDEPVWIHLPRGFRSGKPGETCLRLIKSLYGLSSAPRLWYTHLLEALKEDGFTLSAHDECLLYKDNIIIFLWVDDCGVCAPKMELIDDLIKRLQEKGLSLKKEGNLTDYLGINFIRHENKSITMTQKGLIAKIIKTTGLEDCNPNWTPATQLGLGSDPDGEPMKESWEYRSVVGMLLYLATNTRPDIAFAVSQVARFSSAPKKSHATAIKTIVRYLVRTRDKGTIFTPTTDFKLDCYEDADFAGLHGREPQDNPVSAKSRTGYILTFCGCPLIWRSQLQSSVALSTLQAEYHALSQAMRSVIATRRVIEELLGNLKLPFPKPTIFSEVFEDNSGAFYLATKQRLTPRTKHFNTYLHFFWEHVGDHPGGVKVSMVSTADQKADYFTKCQNRELFERCRKLNQGW